MRYKTFRNLVVAGVVCVGAGGLYLASRGGSEPEAASYVAPDPNPAPAARRVADVPPPPLPQPSDATDASPDALRPMDREILARVAQGISGGKGKDAIKGRPWKVNLYQDAGHSRVNRLKIDLDRDDRWDEKWTFLSDGGTEAVKRQVAPGDDEAYTDEYLLDGERWRRR
jgi:hypothetical protein